ncbi:MFS transporter [Allopusillimonas soli]|uniref:MFS transporter n=2 Tax=Allopusillimonas soli TaxID=659016 RepID=A0A853FF22_9BURK|nr:MFS transporter [Allopusillimonas soli]NYT38653.1 MFS transporter [Allopusillimonas soli]TEA71814.1 MFS transporter [Allopusillimonas soli]
MACAFVVVMAGTTLPTPLYPLYKQQFALSEQAVTVIFATYAFAVLGGLLACGPWSDQVGRRPILAAGLTAAIVSSLLFLDGGRLWILLGARAFSGLSAGLFTATATVAVIELAPAARKAHAALLAACANMGGLGLGPLLAGVVSQYLPWPLHLVYAVHLVLLLAACVVVLRCPETVERPAHLRLQCQRLKLPGSVRPAFAVAAVACFAAFALLGLLTSLEPEILAKVTGVSNRAVIGSLIFLVFVASLCGQILQRRFAAAVRLPLSCLVLILGAGVLAVSMATGSLVLLTLGAVASGLGQGGIFAGSVVAVAAASPDDVKAEVTSLLFVVVYLAVAVPVLGLGVAAVAVGVQTAGIAFTVLVMLLAAGTLSALWRRHRAQVPIETN